MTVKYTKHRDYTAALVYTDMDKLIPANGIWYRVRVKTVSNTPDRLELCIRRFGDEGEYLGSDRFSWEKGTAALHLYAHRTYPFTVAVELDALVYQLQNCWA